MRKAVQVGVAARSALVGSALRMGGDAARRRGFDASVRGALGRAPPTSPAGGAGGGRSWAARWRSASPARADVAGERFAEPDARSRSPPRARRPDATPTGGMPYAASELDRLDGRTATSRRARAACRPPLGQLASTLARSPDACAGSSPWALSLVGGSPAATARSPEAAASPRSRYSRGRCILSAAAPTRAARLLEPLARRPERARRGRRGRRDAREADGHRAGRSPAGWAGGGDRRARDGHGREGRSERHIALPTASAGSSPGSSRSA